MAAVGIITLLLPVLVSGIRQLTIQTDRNTTRITALAPLENAAGQMSRDISLAQATDLGASDPPGNMTLYWINWGDDGNYSSYTPAYKRTRVVYVLSGTKITRTMATCANRLDTDPKCSDLTKVVSPLCDGGPWCINTRWVEGQPALNADGTFNSASRETNLGSPATIARYITTVQFSKNGKLFTIALTSYPKGSGWPGVAQTYRAFGALLE